MERDSLEESMMLLLFMMGLITQEGTSNGKMMLGWNIETNAENAFMKK
jgi:hypothetical protein